MYVTPCIGICQIDNKTNLCIGCKRTVEQITNWINLSNEERLDIMKELGYLKRRDRNNIELENK